MIPVRKGLKIGGFSKKILTITSISDRKSDVRFSSKHAINFLDVKFGNDFESESRTENRTISSGGSFWIAKSFKEYAFTGQLMPEN